MSKKANPTLIGAFVVAGFALLAVAVVLFGGSELLEPKTRLVSYFEGSVKGLKVGSNVLFRGVRIGYVTGIHLFGDMDTLETQVEVRMEILPGAIALTRQGRVVGKEEHEPLRLKDAVKGGLRAQLQIESLVTGQLLVEFDFHPETPPSYRSENPPFMEVPTIPSDAEKIKNTLRRFISDVEGKVDVEAMMEDFAGILDGVEKLVNSPELKASLAGIEQLINAEDTQKLPGSARAAMIELEGTLKDTRALVNNADEKLQPILRDLQPALISLQNDLDGAGQLIEAARSQIRDESELSYQVDGTLRQVEGAARSLRLFLDYLEQHPEALISGKPNP
jgi:paraquat-inducible protein B